MGQILFLPLHGVEKEYGAPLPIFCLKQLSQLSLQMSHPDEKSFVAICCQNRRNQVMILSGCKYRNRSQDGHSYFQPIINLVLLQLLAFPISVADASLLGFYYYFQRTQIFFQRLAQGPLYREKEWRGGRPLKSLSFDSSHVG